MSNADMVLIPRSLYNAYLTQGDRTVREAISSINIRQLNNISDNVKASIQNNDIVKGGLQTGRNLPSNSVNPSSSGNSGSNSVISPPPPPPSPPPSGGSVSIVPPSAPATNNGISVNEGGLRNFGQTNVPVPDNFGQTHSSLSPSTASNVGPFGQNIASGSSGRGVLTTNSASTQISPTVGNVGTQISPSTKSRGDQISAPAGKSASTETEKTTSDALTETDPPPPTHEVGTQSLRARNSAAQTDQIGVKNVTTETVGSNNVSTETDPSLTHEIGTSMGEHSVWDYFNSKRKRRNASVAPQHSEISTQTESEVHRPLTSSVATETDAPKKPELSIVSQKGESIAPSRQPRKKLGKTLATQTELPHLSITRQDQIDIPPKEKKTLSTASQQGIDIAPSTHEIMKTKPRLGFTTLSPISISPVKKKAAKAQTDIVKKTTVNVDAQTDPEVPVKKATADADAQTNDEVPVKKATTDVTTSSTEAQTDALPHFQTVANPDDIVGVQEPSWVYNTRGVPAGMRYVPLSLRRPGEPAYVPDVPNDVYVAPLDDTLESIVTPVKRRQHISNLPRITPRPKRILNPPKKFSPSPIKKKGGKKDSMQVKKTLAKKPNQKETPHLEMEGIASPLASESAAAATAAAAAAEKGKRGGAKKKSAAMSNYEQVRKEERRARIGDQARWIPSVGESRVRLRKKKDREEGEEDTRKRRRTDKSS